MRLTKLIRFVTVLFVALSIVCIAFAVATLHMRQIATVVVIVLNSLVGIAGLLMIYRKVSPIGKLARVVEDVAAGNINLNRDKSLLTKDEIGEISASVYKFTDTVKQMTGDFSSLNAEIHDAGNFTYRIDESVYDGSFKEIVGDANIMVNRFAGDVLAFMDTLTELTDGNFDVRCKQLPGQKAILSQKIEAMSSMLYKVDTEITTLTKSAIKGDLTVRSNVENFSGGWKLLLQNLNELFQAVVEQANWYESILDSIPTPISVTDLDMNWTFINKATEMILGKSRNDVKGQPCHKWGAAICNTPNCGVACVKRGIEQTTFEQFGRNFQVNVAYLKNLAGEKAGHVEVVQDTSRLAEYIKKIDKIMAETKSISDQVSEGARQISVSSQSLASGASSQASAIEELNASIETINSQTHQTAETARNASGLSERAQEHAIKGNEEMSRMVTAMEGIKDATGNIAKIIGTIESIAFQTNLLALNASVEAARAGEHGKGFSVVADEVRTLASRSKNAAQDTNALIFDTTSKVEEGTKIALATAHSFNEIVSDFQTVSKIIHDIASASVEQADSIGQISAGISQIAEITQQNSATSEESAAASEELASQSESLTNMFDGM